MIAISPRTIPRHITTEEAVAAERGRCAALVRDLWLHLPNAAKGSGFAGKLYRVLEAIEGGQ